MTSSDSQSLAQLKEELEGLRARVAQLEQSGAVNPARRTRSKRVALAVALGLTAIGAGTAYAATGTCPNGLPFCFAPNTPAVASQLNQDLAQLKEWLEGKVGSISSNNVSMVGTTTMTGATTVNGATTITGEVRIQTGSQSNASTAAGKPFFVSGVIADGMAATGGVEFRHDNLTQGVGIGYNTIYGTAAGQPLQLRGGSNAGTTVNLLSNVVASGDITVNANTWGYGPNATTLIEMAAPNTDIISRCSNGEFVCGLRIRHGSGVNWYNNYFSVECCSL